MPKASVKSGEHGHHEDAGDETRHGQGADRVGGHGPHGVDLLGDFHRAQFGGQGPAHAAGEHDGGEHGADLFDDA